MLKECLSIKNDEKSIAKLLVKYLNQIPGENVYCFQLINSVPFNDPLFIDCTVQKHRDQLRLRVDSAILHIYPRPDALYHEIKLKFETIQSEKQAFLCFVSKSNIQYYLPKRNSQYVNCYSDINRYNLSICVINILFSTSFNTAYENQKAKLSKTNSNFLDRSSIKIRAIKNLSNIDCVPSNTDDVHNYIHLCLNNQYTNGFLWTSSRGINLTVALVGHNQLKHGFIAVQYPNKEDVYYLCGRVHIPYALINYLSDSSLFTKSARNTAYNIPTWLDVDSQSMFKGINVKSVNKIMPQWMCPNSNGFILLNLQAHRFQIRHYSDLTQRQKYSRNNVLVIEILDASVLSYSLTHSLTFDTISTLYDKIIQDIVHTITMIQQLVSTQFTFKSTALKRAVSALKSQISGKELISLILGYFHDNLSVIGTNKNKLKPRLMNFRNRPIFIKQQLSEDEDTSLEFKYKLHVKHSADSSLYSNDTERIRQTIVAMASTNGGTIVLGVQDNGEVVGVPEGFVSHIRTSGFYPALPSNYVQISEKRIPLNSVDSPPKLPENWWKSPLLKEKDQYMVPNAKVITFIDVGKGLLPFYTTGNPGTACTQWPMLRSMASTLPLSAPAAVVRINNFIETHWKEHNS